MLAAELVYAAMRELKRNYIDIEEISYNDEHGFLYEDILDDMISAVDDILNDKVQDFLER